MNPVILGAIIGAVPGTIAAALTTWTAVHAANVNLKQTQLTVEIEHRQWLRDKRSEIYAEFLIHAEQLFTRRHVIINGLDEITDEDREKIQAIINEYSKPESKELPARAATYAPPDTAEIYGGMVCMMDFAFWVIILAKINDPERPQFEVDADVKEIWARADSGLKQLRNLAYRDLQATPPQPLHAEP